MKMKKMISLLALALLMASSCGQGQEKAKTKIQEEKEISLATSKTNLKDKVESAGEETKMQTDSLGTLDFSQEKKAPFDKEGNFILYKADMERLNKLSAALDDEEHYSLTYLHLMDCYGAIAEKDSIQYNTYGEGADEVKYITAFKQKFNGDINYSCGEYESGGGEIIELPKLPLKALQGFVETLYHSSDNKWISDYEYEPDGAGCYCKIIQLKERSRIEVSCGC